MKTLRFILASKIMKYLNYASTWLGNKLLTYVIVECQWLQYPLFAEHG